MVPTNRLGTPFRMRGAEHNMIDGPAAPGSSQCVVFDSILHLEYYFGTETFCGRGQHMSKQAATVDELDSVIWDLGRAYFAYVGLLERVLVEYQLDHILRPGMGLVLFTLFEQDSRTIKELSERSQLAYSTLTGVLKRMEKAGLVVRTRDKQDKRLVRVTLTPQARKLKGKCQKISQRMSELSLQGIGLSNLARCKKYLSSMTSAFRSEEQRLADIQCPNKDDHPC